jgi:hypothetical protein
MVAYTHIVSNLFLYNVEDFTTLLRYNKKDAAENLQKPRVRNVVGSFRDKMSVKDQPK